MLHISSLVTVMGLCFTWSKWGWFLPILLVADPTTEPRVRAHPHGRLRLSSSALGTLQITLGTSSVMTIRSSYNLGHGNDDGYEFSRPRLRFNVCQKTANGKSPFFIAGQWLPVRSSSDDNGGCHESPVCHKNYPLIIPRKKKHMVKTISKPYQTILKPLTILRPYQYLPLLLKPIIPSWSLSFTKGQSSQVPPLDLCRSRRQLKSVDAQTKAAAVV